MKIPKCNRPGCQPHYRERINVGSSTHEISCGQSGCLRKVSEPTKEQAVLKWIELINKPLKSDVSRGEFDDGW